MFSGRCLFGAGMKSEVTGLLTNTVTFLLFENGLSMASSLVAAKQFLNFTVGT